MDIGRKIYYDKATGNVLQDCSERSGLVVETTQEEDFQSYVALNERVPSTVAMVQLSYGQYADKFGVYNYNINTETNNIVWGDLIIFPALPKTEVEINSERIDAMENAIMFLMG